MASLTIDLYSNVLGQAVGIRVILPDPAASTRIAGGGGCVRPQQGWPVLWLLHGLSDDESAWVRRTSIERYVANLGLAVVMPAVGRSFYTDMHRGLSYFTYVAEELPELCREMFRLSMRREDNFLAGLSMGGYGALKLALTHPDRYAAAASLSGAVDMAHRLSQSQTPYDKLHVESAELIFGTRQIAGTPHDLRRLSSEVVSLDPHDRPELFLACGTDDHLYPDHVQFTEHLESIGYPATLEVHDGRDHEWGYWDYTIQHVLDWLPLEAGRVDTE